MRPRATPDTTTRGYTLVELMIVVAIVGILAALATYGVRKYIASSKTSEAMHMIANIKSAQESLLSETFNYLHVSNVGTLSEYYPVNDKPGQKKAQWGGGTDAIAANWRTLGVNPNGPVLFVYACQAGAAGAIPAPGMTVANWPGTQSAPWYVVRAYADLDAGGEQSVFVGASFTTQLFSENDGE